MTFDIILVGIIIGGLIFTIWLNKRDDAGKSWFDENNDDFEIENTRIDKI